MPHLLLESINKEIQWLETKGYIRPSTSHWDSSMVTVQKPDGTARLCVDFKAINACPNLHAQGGGGPRECGKKLCDFQTRSN